MVEEKYLVFDISEQSYAINIGCIKEIINGCGRISPVPEFPEYSKGVINLRGDIVPIIDMRMRFHLPPMEENNKMCVIVTESKQGQGLLGFLVDKVRTVMDFTVEKISSAPKIATTASKYVIGVYNQDGQIILLLSPDELLTDNLVEAIDNYMAANNIEADADNE